MRAPRRIDRSGTGLEGNGRWLSFASVAISMAFPGFTE